MTAWSKPMTWVASKPVTSTQMNTVRDNLLNLDERLTLHGITSESALNKVKSALCGVRVKDAGTQSITDGTETTLTWDTETYDSDGFHSTSVNTGRITIPAGLGGYYVVSANLQWPYHASTGMRRIWVEDQDGTVLGITTTDAVGTSGVATHNHLTFLAELPAGSWIAVKAFQTATASLSANKSTDAACFAAWRVMAL